MSSQRGNEAEIGKALSEIYSDWLVNRPNTWITGKVWHEGDACPTADDVRGQVSATLAALKVDYLDLCLLPAHSDMSAFKVRSEECFPNFGIKGSCRRSSWAVIGLFRECLIKHYLPLSGCLHQLLSLPRNVSSLPEASFSWVRDMLSCIGLCMVPLLKFLVLCGFDTFLWQLVCT